MRLVSSRNPCHRASLMEAIARPIAPDGGIYVPDPVACFRDTRALLKMGFRPRCVEILHRCLGDELDRNSLEVLVERSLDFPVALHALRKGLFVLELFHGPSACVQDAGARLLAGLMVHAEHRLHTLLAVGLEEAIAAGRAFGTTRGLRVVALVPRSEGPLPLAGLGANIQAFAVEGTRQEVEAMAMACLGDAELRSAHGLTCLGTANIAVRLAALLLCFEGLAQISAHWGDAPVLGIPSGLPDFQDAAFLAHRMGLPLRAIVTGMEGDTTAGLLRPARLEPGDLRHAQWELNACGFLPEPQTAEAFGLLQGRLGLADVGLILAPRHPGFDREELGSAFNLDVAPPPGWEEGWMEMKLLEASAGALKMVL